jgi:hypothetical protein
MPLSALDDALAKVPSFSPVSVTKAEQKPPNLPPNLSRAQLMAAERKAVQLGPVSMLCKSLKRLAPWLEPFERKSLLKN